MPTRNQLEVTALLVAVDEELVLALALHIDLTFCEACVLDGETSEIETLAIDGEGQTCLLAFGERRQGTVHIHLIEVNLLPLRIECVRHKRLCDRVGTSQTNLININCFRCHQCRQKEQGE